MNYREFSQEEMAEMLGITVNELHTHMENYQIGLSFMVQQQGRYRFNPPSVENNLAVWACWKQHGRHEMVFKEYYDERLKKAVYKCKHCLRQTYD